MGYCGATRPRLSTQTLRRLAISNATSLERMQEQEQKLFTVESVLRATMDRGMQNLTTLRNTRLCKVEHPHR